MKNNYLEYLSVIHSLMQHEIDQLENLIEYSDDGIGTPLREAKQTAMDAMIPIASRIKNLQGNIARLSLKDLKKKYI